MLYGTHSSVTGGVGCRWYRGPECDLEIGTSGWSLYRGNQDKTRIGAGSKSYLLCYTRERVKREEMEIPQHLTTSLYIHFVWNPRTSPHAPMYHLNIPSWSSTPSTQLLIDTTTPHRPTLQHHKPRPYPNIVYRHHLTTFSCHSRVYQHLHMSVTLIPFTHPILFICTIHTHHSPLLPWECSSFFATHVRTKIVDTPLMLTSMTY